MKNKYRHVLHHPSAKPKRKKRAPCIRISVKAFWEIGNTIGGRPAESGGIIGGHENGNLISHFAFDTSSACSASTYAPDIPTMQAVLDGWRESGVRFRGFVHSHPDGCPNLSEPDIRYIGRLLTRCPYLDYFLAPIVLPSSGECIPWVVYRDDPIRPVRASVRLA